MAATAAAAAAKRAVAAGSHQGGRVAAREDSEAYKAASGKAVGVNLVAWVEKAEKAEKAAEVA